MPPAWGSMRVEPLLGQLRSVVTLAVEPMMQSLAAARNPLELATAQTGLALALAEWSATPTRAWLDSLPRLHACCMAAVEGAGEANFPNGTAAPAAAPGRIGPAHDRAAAE